MAADAIKEALESNSEKASKFADFQFRLLIGGALLYIAYHITDMVVLTIHGAKKNFHGVGALATKTRS